MKFDFTDVTKSKTKLIQRICITFLSTIVLALNMHGELIDHTYTSESIATGSKTYVQQCALCHGPDGAWIGGVNLAQGRFITAETDDDLRQVILEGSGEGRMPAFALDPKELNGVIAFIRTGFDPGGNEVRIGNPDRGKILFSGSAKCSSCHRVDGVGPRVAPDLSDIGIRRTAAALQRSLKDPITALMPIDRAVKLITRDEEVIEGRRLNEDTFSVQLIDSNERLRSIPKEYLISYEISQIPTHNPTDLNDDELADLIAYLLALTP